ncbi:hypothetical protein JK628_02835 [Shewanella sp. KX20019]|uniref:hypothetical protein n=1 Tax=Shewanella sp. KX20019 TaxID=2803864 RepID=UPI001928C4B0|nr:hypothetical protein [Shewanella sp. KX20019]QQX80825.1 hypothetical protein JK628_02835 [Shewanella sp. KX20019]
MSPQTNIAKPNYEENCCNCGQTPTVEIYNEKGILVHSLDMCGVCTWGESACLDPEEWN